MALDYRQVHEQVRRLGENAPQRERELKGLRQQAGDLLQSNAHELERLRHKVQFIVQAYDHTLRCALPVEEALDGCFPLPISPEKVTILAADGSQIAPDRHAEVEYGLINIGAIQMCAGTPDPPRTSIFTHLLYDNELDTSTGTISEDTLALMRDLDERARLAELAKIAKPPVITFTDGPMELWGVKDADSSGASIYQKNLEEYKKVLHELYDHHIITAGYVDKPGANLVVRLLEVAIIPEGDLPQIRKTHPLRGVTDWDLYYKLLSPGERSAVFAMQSYSAQYYQGPLTLHFFYLNVGRPEHPWLARVEIPSWVAKSVEMLDALQATLAGQCRIMGNRPYPYLLHRAHEAAVVSLEEKDQVTQMIALELRRRGVMVGERSYKQSAKELEGRTSYR